MFAGIVIGIFIGGIFGAGIMCCIQIASNTSSVDCNAESNKLIDDELQKILNNEDKRITLFELKDILRRLKKACVQSQTNVIDKGVIKFYVGEINAFQICLDLLEHLWIGGN